MYMAFFRLKNLPSVPHLLSDFYHYRVLNFIKCFFLHQLRYHNSIDSINVAYYTDFGMFKHLFILGINLIWS